MTKAELLELVTVAARSFGIRVYSRGVDTEFPDLVLTGTAMLYREIETDEAIISEGTSAYLTSLRMSGCDADIWRPADWPVRIWAELYAIRRK